MDLEQRMRSIAEVVDQHVGEVLKQSVVGKHPALLRLRETVEYATLGGGKRFRPVLCLLVHEMLTGETLSALPFAAALEMVHSYSLVHDDLPCMDNDDLRRGRPTVHKAFDEATALLGGNALLTEAFYWIAHSYRAEPGLATSLTELLALASGGRGMLGGQMIDIRAAKISDESLSAPDLDFLHSLKTGALIRAAAVGGARIAKASDSQMESVRKYAEFLGLAFQVADDLHDYSPSSPEKVSYPGVVGVAAAKSYLDDLTQSSIDQLKGFGERANWLIEIARFNQRRTH